MTVQYAPPTPRKKISRRESARLFLLHNGICANCGRQIRPGEKWFVEHVDALVLGGADNDANRRPAHLKCKAGKDASDAAARARRDRIITQGLVSDEAVRPRPYGRGFRKSPPQRNATTPIKGKFGGDVLTRARTV